VITAISVRRTRIWKGR